MLHFDFSNVPGFPNAMPSTKDWGDCLPRFREDDDDFPTQHLIDFHKCMRQLGIFHEDVLMKMFMISLEGDARQWYKALPPGSISSLREFHACFHYHCRIIFRAELLFEDCCNEESIEQVPQENHDDEGFTDEDCDQELWKNKFTTIVRMKKICWSMKKHL
jgi:hypothetical protein